MSSKTKNVEKPTFKVEDRSKDFPKEKPLKVVSINLKEGVDSE